MSIIFYLIVIRIMAGGASIEFTTIIMVVIRNNKRNKF